jgi:tripartite-type tricarboxylate transporter receptor subunit TctC
VENKPGASGIVAADYVARSRPDGLTVLVSSLGTLANNTVLYEKLPYDPNKDFAPVTQIAYQPAIIVGRADLPYHNIKEMVAYAKANPGKINRGSPGAAILTNLAPMSFEKNVGISTTHIPFNGDAPAVQALLGGQIDIHGTSLTGSLPHIRSGKLRVLGVMDSRRLPQLPEAPTFKEMGYDLEATLWYSLSVPSATPKDAIDRLNKAVNQVIADPEFVAKARAIGMEPRGGTPEELAKFVRAEHDRWVPLLQSLNLPKQVH